MSSDVRPATDAELAEYRKLCSAEMRAVLARLAAAERERDEARAEYVVLHDMLDHDGRSHLIGMASNLIRELRQAREAAEADSEYQRARAEHYRYALEETDLMDDQEYGVVRWPADRPDGWTPEE